MSRSSLRRHLASHAAPELREALRGSETLNIPDLLQRLADIANDAQQTRRAALDAENPTVALKAGDAELRALAAIMGRLGIDNLEIIDQLRQGESLAQAIGALARTSPHAAKILAVELQDREPEMAAELHHIATKHEKREFAS